MARIAVIGSGIVGALSALLARDAGHDVDLFEKEASLWAGASASNEGKIHLGPIFALGDRATHRLMLEGSTTFAPIVERAVGASVVWAAMKSQDFEYLVMPGSLASPQELASRYSGLNAMLSDLPHRSYLGEPLSSVIDEKPQRDAGTGLPRFASRERSIDPLALRAIVLAALAREGVNCHVGMDVISVEQRDGSPALRFRDSTVSDSYAAVINAAWENQGRLVPSADWHTLNYRVKLALRVPPGAFERALTLVHGPFGDIVALPDATYLSWYPVGRLAHGVGFVPPTHVETAHETLRDNDRAARGIMEALRRTGLWDGAGEPHQIIGGFILGHGAVDIDSRDSELHARSEFHVVRSGALFTPVNFKLTTGPLAAQRAVEAIGEVFG